MLNITAIQEAISDIEYKIDTVKGEFTNSIEQTKNETIEYLNIVNREIKKEIDALQDNTETAVGLARMDCAKAIIATERNLSLGIDNINNKTLYCLDEIETFKLDIVDIINKQIAKQLSWENIWKILLGKIKGKLANWKKS